MDQIIKVAWDLNENTDNRYKLVYEIFSRICNQLKLPVSLQSIPLPLLSTDSLKNELNHYIYLMQYKNLHCTKEHSLRA